MTPANESGIGLIEDIRQHPTTVQPDVVPVWARYDPRKDEFVQRTGSFEWDLLVMLRELGMTPVVYAESGGMSPEGIISGHYDRALSLMAARCRGADIRWNHEMNGLLFEWGKWPVLQFKAAWVRVADLFHAEGARIIYCPAARGKRDDDLLLKYPGDQFVDVMAFTEFKRDDKEPLPPLHFQWRYTTERLATTGKPVWVCETGAETDTSRRGEWMASLDEVKGVKVILIFDFLIEYVGPSGKPASDDWRWSGAMVKQWDLLSR
jgi:hypothetical protein